MSRGFFWRDFPNDNLTPKPGRDSVGLKSGQCQREVDNVCTSFLALPNLKRWPKADTAIARFTDSAEFTLIVYSDLATVSLFESCKCKVGIFFFI